MSAGAAAEAEGVGGFGGQEVDGAAAGLEVGGVVEVGPDLAVVLERLGIGPGPREARADRRASASIRSSRRPSTCPSAARAPGSSIEHGVEDRRHADRRRIAAGLGGAGADGVDRGREVRRRECRPG